MNTKSIDDHIEYGDDENDCNCDVVENGGRLEMVFIVNVQTSQHQKDNACQNLQKGNLIIYNSSTMNSQICVSCVKLGWC